MYNPSLRGYILRQVDFKKTNYYYEFAEDFEWEVPASTEIDWPEAFAVGRQYYDISNQYQGHFYFIGSRNGDLEANDNVRIYENTP